MCWFVHSLMGECLTCAVFQNFKVPLLKILGAWVAFENLVVLLLKALECVGWIIPSRALELSC